jgi:hypothetical protein
MNVKLLTTDRVSAAERIQQHVDRVMDRLTGNTVRAAKRGQAQYIEDLPPEHTALDVARAATARQFELNPFTADAWLAINAVDPEIRKAAASEVEEMLRLAAQGDGKIWTNNGGGWNIHESNAAELAQLNSPQANDWLKRLLEVQDVRSALDDLKLRDSSSDPQPALCAAVLAGNAGAAQVIVEYGWEHGVDLTQETTRRGMSPMHMALQMKAGPMGQEYEPVVDYLKSVNAPNLAGEGPKKEPMLNQVIGAVDSAASGGNI